MTRHIRNDITTRNNTPKTNIEEASAKTNDKATTIGHVTAIGTNEAK